MGFLAKILNFSGRKVKIDAGGGDILTSENYAPAGDDSQPLVTDSAVAIRTVKTGSAATIGYRDAKNVAIAAVGEKRIYARKVDGTVVAEIWLKNNGSITIKNDVCELILATDGGMKGTNNSGGFELTPAGVFTVDKLKIGGIDFDIHVHGGVTTGAGVTGVPQ